MSVYVAKMDTEVTTVTFWR